MAPLEDVPDSEKDWHPGSNGLVLDLVHPSLYPIVYGRTAGKDQESTTTSILVAPDFGQNDSKFTSKQFQWLPSDFFIDQDGKVTLTSPYINNVHLIQHKELYSVVPRILERAVPMFERVLADLTRSLLPMRIATSDRGWAGEEAADCIWEDGMPRPNLSSEEEFDEDQDAWYSKQPFNTPDARESYSGDLTVLKDRIPLRDRTLQVIVKLANIILTPKKPDYPGGKWHVEGSYEHLSTRAHDRSSCLKVCETRR